MSRKKSSEFTETKDKNKMKNLVKKLQKMGINAALCKRPEVLSANS